MKSLSSNIINFFKSKSIIDFMYLVMMILIVTLIKDMVFSMYRKRRDKQWFMKAFNKTKHKGRDSNTVEGFSQLCVEATPPLLPTASYCDKLRFLLCDGNFDKLKSLLGGITVLIGGNDKFTIRTNGGDIRTNGGHIVSSNGDISTNGGNFYTNGGFINTINPVSGTGGGNISTGGGWISTVGGNIMTVGGDFSTNNITASGNINAGNDIEAINNISAHRDIRGTDIIARKNINAGNDISADNDIHAIKNISADNDIHTRLGGNINTWGGNINTKGGNINTNKHNHGVGGTPPAGGAIDTGGGNINTKGGDLLTEGGDLDLTTTGGWKPADTGNIKVQGQVTTRFIGCDGSNCKIIIRQNGDSAGANRYISTHS